MVESQQQTNTFKIISPQLNLLHCLHLCYSPLLEILREKDMVGLVKVCLENMPSMDKLPEEITKAKLTFLRRSVETAIFKCDG